jgi:hypothetical protein
LLKHIKLNRTLNRTRKRTHLPKAPYHTTTSSNRQQRNGKSPLRPRPRCIPPAPTLGSSRQALAVIRPCNFNGQTPLGQLHAASRVPQSGRCCRQASSSRRSSSRRHDCRACLALLRRDSRVRRTRHLDSGGKGKDSKSNLHISLHHSQGQLPCERARRQRKNLCGNRCTLSYLTSLELPKANINHQGPLATIPDPIPFFYSDVEPAAAAHAASLLLPHAIEAFFSTTQYDGCADFPVTYVVCNNDKALTVEYQHKAIEICRSRENRKGGPEAVEVVTMESGHSPFLSMPEETVKVLLSAAGESL